MKKYIKKVNLKKWLVAVLCMALFITATPMAGIQVFATEILETNIPESQDDEENRADNEFDINESFSDDVQVVDEENGGESIDYVMSNESQSQSLEYSEFDVDESEGTVSGNDQISINEINTTENISNDAIGDAIIASGQCGDDLTWTLTNGALTISGTGEMYDYEMYTAPWWEYSSLLKSLVIENGVTKIGTYAFYNCSGFTGNLIIPDSVTEIGYGAFSGCRGFIGELKLSENITNIKDFAFYGCDGFTGELKLPDGVTEIGHNAFEMCRGFTGTLVIPDSVTGIGSGAFCYCYGFTGTLIIPDSVTWIGPEAFCDCSGFTGDLIISDSVTEIGYNAFENCSGFTGNLKLSNCMTSIADCTFSGCSGFTGDLIIPNSVERIGNNAFYACRGFNGKLEISDSVTKIDGQAFRGCSGFTGDLVIPNNATQIGHYAFCNCSGFTGNLIIPDSVTEIGYSAFEECKGFTGELKLPENITVIEEDAFLGCSGFTGELKLPQNITMIEAGAFLGCSGFTGELKLPENLTSIEASTFSGCSGLEGDLVIPKSVTKIGYSAFSNCSGFTGELKLSENITMIEASAFSGCSGFTGDLKIPGSITSIENSVFYGCNGFTGNLIIPDSVVRIDDQAFRGCSGFTGNLIISNNVKEIGRFAFAECRGFTGDLKIPDSVISIAYGAFNWSGFTGELKLPENLTCIEASTFSGCSGFTGNLVIPDSVTEIGESAFSNCSGFTGELKLPENITSIASETFSGCSGFEGDLVIPQSVIEIGSSAFYNCSGFTGELKLPENITSIAGRAFSGCSGFEGDLVIPNSVTEIGYSAFSDCSGFTGELKIPDSVIKIGSNAFYKCSGFTGNLEISENVKQIDAQAFCGISNIKNVIFTGDMPELGNDAFSEILARAFYPKANLTWSNFASDNDKQLSVANNIIWYPYEEGERPWEMIFSETAPSLWFTFSTVPEQLIYDNGYNQNNFTMNISVLCMLDLNNEKPIYNNVTVEVALPDGLSFSDDEDNKIVTKYLGTMSLDGIKQQDMSFDVYIDEEYVEKEYNVNVKLTADGYETPQFSTYVIPIELIHSDDTGGSNPDDITVPNDKFMICAVDIDTGKIIQNVTISVDGKNYKPSNGILYMDVNSEDAYDHSVYATADGYWYLNSVTYTSFEGGKSLVLSFQKAHSVTYVVGILEAHSDDKYQINGIWYDEADESDASTVHNNKQYVDSLINNYIFCWLNDGKVSVIQDLKEFVELSAIGSSGEKTFTYQNGRFISNQYDFNISLKSQKTSQANELSLDIPSEFFNKTISKVYINTSESSNVVLSKNGRDDFANSIVIELNGESVNLNKSAECSFVMKLKSNDAPAKTSSEDTVFFSVVCDDGSKYVFCTRVHYINADLKQSKVEDKKNKDCLDKGTPTKDEICNTLQNNLLFNLYFLESNFGMTSEQVEAINELLTLWIANIDATTDTAREISNDEKFVKTVLGKLGVNLNSWLTLSQTTAQIKIKVNTEKYGDRTFCFVLDMQNYHWNDDAPYAKFGTVDWYVEETNGIPTSCSGKCAMIAKADPERLINQLRDLSIDAIKNAYNSAWGNSANKVAEEILDKRFLDLIGEKYDNTSNMIFTLLLDATKSSVNSKSRIKTVTKCPVDLYVYDSFGNLAGSIIDNIAYPVDDGVLVYMDGESKVVVYCADEYTIQFVGTGTGTMSHEIYEYRDTGEEYVRHLEFSNIPLEKDIIYYEYIPDRLFADSNVYELEGENGEIILPDEDTHISVDLVYVEGILIEPKTLSLKVGDSQLLKSIIEPENASTQFVKWESNDDNIATVDDEGKVNAVSEGTATISAISIDGRFIAECVVNVSNKSNGTTDPSGDDTKETLPPPTPNIDSGSAVEKGTEVSLTCSENDAQIFYTLNETVPTEESTLYTVPIVINADTIIKAISVKPGYTNSEIAVFTYKIKETDNGDEDNGKVDDDAGNDTEDDNNIENGGTGGDNTGGSDTGNSGSGNEEDFETNNGTGNTEKPDTNDTVGNTGETTNDNHQADSNNNGQTSGTGAQGELSQYSGATSPLTGDSSYQTNDSGFPIWCYFFVTFGIVAICAIYIAYRQAQNSRKKSSKEDKK